MHLYVEYTMGVGHILWGNELLGEGRCSQSGVFVFVFFPQISVFILFLLLLSNIHYLPFKHHIDNLRKYLPIQLLYLLTISPSHLDQISTESQVGVN